MKKKKICYKPVIINSFHSSNYIDLKVRVIEKHCQKRNILIKLNHKSKIINVLRKCDTQKIQLTIAINFISSKDDNDEEREMHSKMVTQKNIEIMINDEADEVIDKLFESLKKRYQNKLEESMKDSEFGFDHVHLLYYKCHKINPN